MPRRKKMSIVEPISKRTLSPIQEYRDDTITVVTTGNKNGKAYTPTRNLSILEIKEYCLTSIWIDICINTIVDEVVKYPLVVEDPNDPNREFKNISAMLKYPNPTETLYVLRKQYLKDMLKYGNGACLIQYKGGSPMNLISVPGYTLRVVDNIDGTAKEPQYKFLEVDSNYTFKKDAKGAEIKAMSLKEVMHFAIDKDSDESLGRSALEKCVAELDTDSELSSQIKTYLQHGLYHPSMVSVEKANSKDMEKFLEFVNNGLGDGNKMFGINKKLEFKDIPCWNAKDMIDMSKYLGLKIGNVFKVPPFMLNLIEDTGSLNAREQKQRFIENVIMPILEYEAQVYTLVLVRMGFKEDRAVITSPAIASKLTYDKAKIAGMLVEKGIMTTDEARKTFFNLKPLKESK